MPDAKREERRQRAIENAKLAYKLIDDKEAYRRLLEAIEEKNKPKFIELCSTLGIEKDPRANKLWRLIKYESGKEATNICW